MRETYGIIPIDSNITKSIKKAHISSQRTAMHAVTATLSMYIVGPDELYSFIHISDSIAL